MTAIGASLLAFLAGAGVGGFLIIVQDSGARMPGALIASGAAIGLAAAMFLLFASNQAFRGITGRATAVMAALLAATPLLALAYSAVVLADVLLRLQTWAGYAILGAAACFVLGTLAIAWLAYDRTRKGPVRGPVDASVAYVRDVHAGRMNLP